MEKKQNYNFIKKYKNVIYGVDKGFEYLDFLILELKKQELNSGKIRVYDYKKDEYFNVNEDNINSRVQELYLEFVFKEQILKSESYIKVYNNLIKKLKTTNPIGLKNYSLIVKLFFLLLKEINMDKSVLENKIEKSEFLTKIVRTMNKCVLDNTKINTEMAELIIDIMVEEKIIEQYYVNFSLRDKNLFSSLKYMRNQMVDVYSQEFNVIKYSTNHLMSELYKVVIGYSNNLNLDTYNSLLHILENDNKLEQIRSFILDFVNIQLFPKDFDIKDHKAIAFFERIHLNKLILNEYCFNVLAVSCFDNYFFTKDKLGNILLQKTDPRLNLNPNIYEVVFVE
ncbi:MAG: hypothetical protein EOP33_06585 [Rickettsiaceae bacterium]|nr:MAG: hypothetical protein EOP33_06585 [Rickettsiaceae bacterium]